MPGILFISNFISDKVGTRSVAEDLSEHLRDTGWAVYTASNEMRRAPRLIDMISTTIRNRNNYQVGCVDVYSGQAFIWAEITSFFLRRLKKPYILCLHGGGLPDFASRRPGRVRLLLAAANQVVTPSRYVQDKLTALRQDITYIPNAITIANYPFRLRRQAMPRLCWLRAFHQIYNPELAVETLAIIAGDFPEASLNMIGPDKKDGSLQTVYETAKRLKVEDRLRITGSIAKSAVPGWLDKGEIFINTTRLESFGVAVLEAAACGLPIVSTNVGELPYLWKNGKEVFLTPVSDAQAMAKAVRKYLTMPEIVGEMTINARNKAEMHDRSIILPQWEDLFMKLALK